MKCYMLLASAEASFIRYATLFVLTTGPNADIMLGERDGGEGNGLGGGLAASSL